MFVIGQVKSDNLNLKQPIKPEIKAVNMIFQHFVIDALTIITIIIIFIKYCYRTLYFKTDDVLTLK